VALAESLAVILVLRFLDVVEREPKRLIALAMLLGDLHPAIHHLAITQRIYLVIVRGR
jgi:hypothetical protein